MGAMATWEDGPEYAPIERPADFSVPDAAPLEQAPAPYQPAASAPKDRPHFDRPGDPGTPLATIVPATGPERDPMTPFDVVAATVTSDSAWAAAHWSAPAGPAGPAWQPGPPAPAYGQAGPAAHPYAPEPQPVPSPAPWSLSAPVAPPLNGASVYPPPTDELPLGGFPAPGTPQWFGPGPVQPEPRRPVPVDARRVAETVTPGVLICLVLGGLFSLLAPVTLPLAFALSSRISVAQQQIRRAFAIAVLVLSFIALIAALLSSSSFNDWWGDVGRWAMLASWGMLAVVLVSVTRALRAPDPPPPPGYRPPRG
jgi:hypothetical protein